MATARKAFNAIIILISVSGIEATSPQEIGNLSVTHFLNMLGPQMPSTTPLMISTVADMIRTYRFSCSPAQAVILSRLPSPKDITKTMFKLNRNKSPGPDGFTSGFYTATWDLLGLRSHQCNNRLFQNFSHAGFYKLYHSNSTSQVSWLYNYKGLQTYILLQYPI